MDFQHAYAHTHTHTGQGEIDIIHTFIIRLSSYIDRYFFLK